jgi:hypothetical protein
MMYRLTMGVKKYNNTKRHVLSVFFGYFFWVLPAYSFARAYPYNDFDINPDGYFQFHMVPCTITPHYFSASA